MKLSLQFHALPEEANALVEYIMADADVWASRLKPSRTAAFLERENVQAVRVEGGETWAFTIREPELGARSAYEFLGPNPDALILAVGRRTENHLEESWLAAKTDDPVSMAKWKQVATRLRKMSHAGASFVGPDGGKPSTLRGHRFTDGARRAYQGGSKILPIAGNSIIHLD